MIPNSVLEFDIGGSANELPWFDEIANARRYFFFCSSSLSTDIAYLAETNGETKSRIYSTGPLTYSNPDHDAGIAERLSHIDPESPSYADAMTRAIDEFSPSRSELMAAYRNADPIVDQEGVGNRKDLDRLLSAAAKVRVDMSSNLISSVSERFVYFDGNVHNDIRCWYRLEHARKLFDAIESVFRLRQGTSVRNETRSWYRLEHARKLFGAIKSAFR